MLVRREGTGTRWSARVPSPDGIERRARTTSNRIGSRETNTMAISINSMLFLTKSNRPSQNPSNVTPAAHATPPMIE